MPVSNFIFTLQRHKEMVLPNSTIKRFKSRPPAIVIASRKIAVGRAKKAAIGNRIVKHARLPTKKWMKKVVNMKLIIFKLIIIRLKQSDF